MKKERDVSIGDILKYKRVALDSRDKKYKIKKQSTYIVDEALDFTNDVILYNINTKEWFLVGRSNVVRNYYKSKGLLLEKLYDLEFYGKNGYED